MSLPESMVIQCGRGSVVFFSCTLLEKKVVTSLFEAIKSIWMEFLCFQWAEMHMKCTCDCYPMKSDLTLAGLLLQCQVGSSKSKTAA